MPTSFDRALRGVAPAVIVAAAAASAHAGTVIKLTLDDLGQPSTDPDVGWRAGSFTTLNDAIVATTGDQNSTVDFVGDLGGLADITAGASFTLTGIDAAGAPMAFGGIIVQPTSGGEFSLYAADNSLLLRAEIHDGSLTGSGSGSAASFFTIDSMVLTGGSLLSLLQPSPSALAIALTDVDSGGTPGLRIEAGALARFTASATLNIDALVPAPASALVLTGLLGGIARRRRI